MINPPCGCAADRGRWREATEELLWCGSEQQIADTIPAINAV